MATARANEDKIDPEVLKSALILVIGALAVVFDTTIVSVALHTLAARLHTSLSVIQWVTTGYLLALGIAVPLSTWGLQRFGGKRLWMFALTVFLAGSSAPAWRGMPGRSSPGVSSRARAAASCSRSSPRWSCRRQAARRSAGPSRSSRCPPCWDRSSDRSSAAPSSPT